MRLFIYSIVDGLSGLKRSGISSLLTILTICCSLVLLGAFYIIRQGLRENLQETRSRFVLEAFLLDAEPKDHETTGEKILHLAGVDSIEYVSKDDALARVRETFGDDYLALIEDNPLPASFHVVLQPSYVNRDSVARIVAAIAGVPGVEDVVYRATLIDLLNRYDRLVGAGFIIFGIALSILGFVLISNNIRLTIEAKRDIIETMELVGASRGLIVGPLLIQAMIEGGLGALFAGIVLSVLVQVGTIFIPVLSPVTAATIGVLVLVGILFGFLGSFNALGWRIRY
ncbi:MAG TPA: ABC transporter permease [Bacteroidetes bacterium]|nr:ABC transporter permease [Bacteroidota bacterium]